MTDAAAQSRRTRIVVIGIGNPFRGDDGAGIEASRRLQHRVPPGVEVLEADGESTALIDAWHDGRLAYVIDAVRADGPAGAIHRIEVDREGGGAVPADPAHDSSHALGLGDAVELARVLDRMPDRLVLLGITGARFDVGDTMSDAVQSAIELVVDQIAKEVQATCA